jgi:site-specific recombinase XerD
MDILIVADQFYDYSKFIRGLSKETLKNYKDVISFFSKSIEVSDLNEVTDKVVRDFLLMEEFKEIGNQKLFLVTKRYLWCFLGTV